MMPLQLKFKAAVNKLPKDKDGVFQVVKNQSAQIILMKLGVLAKAIILQAFDTRGFGRWKPSQMQYKKVKQTLVETQQLRNSINFRVKEVQVKRS
jgi:hypothetical protein